MTSSWLDRDYCAICGSMTGCCHFTPRSVLAAREEAGRQAEEERKKVVEVAAYLLSLVDEKAGKYPGAYQYPGQEADLIKGTLESLRKHVQTVTELQEKADET